MTHPYSSLPPDAFWKTAVSDRSFFDIQNLWKPKHPFRTEHRFVTFGSCFAQHLGRALVAHGFNWWNVESGVKAASADVLAKYGYGVFSARTGNIYTAKALRQWVSWAFGHSACPPEVWKLDGRFYDPFRPNIEPHGFASPDELYASREITLACLRKAFSRADVVVFTLGLTEAWEHGSGYVYAGCPGASAGEFLQEIHGFRNYTHAMVLQDLRAAIDLIRAQNRNVRFLLTVSPVPLVATASDQHVLVANTHSKSLLRAVAGQCSAEDPAVDYFPSYEIVTAHPYRGAFFDPNLRSVNANGVAYVMRHFIEAVLPAQPVPTHPKPTAQRTKSSSDIQCEEEMLESFAPLRTNAR